MEPADVNGSVHTGCKPHQRICPQICVLASSELERRGGLDAGKRPCWRQPLLRTAELTTKNDPFLADCSGKQWQTSWPQCTKPSDTGRLATIHSALVHPAPSLTHLYVECLLSIPEKTPVTGLGSRQWWLEIYLKLQMRLTFSHLLIIYAESSEGASCYWN